ncbi:MAG TPA: aminoglycoside phosphotransferase family protein [Thermoleophilaceae bacterium]|nr:aminoglycoside phosphotransferase family protein [Thermoleophilaceae bacterium]
MLRLLWSADREPWLDREEIALRAASAAGAPVPAVYDRVTFDGRPGLVMERADGPDLLTRLGSRPWTIRSAGRTLGRLHARLHAVQAPSELPSLKDNVRALLDRGSGHVPAELEAEAREALARLPDGDRLCHGDFHPGNVLLTPAGPRVIDWTGGSRGDPLADVCRSRLIVRLAAIPEEAPALVRRLERAGRSWLLGAYLRAYGSVDPPALGRWERVALIARLAEGIDEERTALLDALGRRERLA